jgi:hypothetical protein
VTGLLGTSQLVNATLLLKLTSGAIGAGEAFAVTLPQRFGLRMPPGGMRKNSPTVP